METFLYEARYLTPFIDAMGDMVRVVAEDDKVLITNLAFKRTMGDKPCETCFSQLGLERKCPYCLTKNVLKSGRVHKQTRKMNGKIYSVTASPLMGVNGKPMAVIEAFRDITTDFYLKQELLRSNTIMHNDLDLARRLQFALVRHSLKDIKGARISAGFFPCEAVGGDIYDYFKVGGKLVMYVSDVSGHGVMPAMMAVSVLRMIRQICDAGILTPDGILRRLQKHFNELYIDESIYITAFIIVLDIATGELTYANAGLSVPPLVFDGGNLIELFMPSRPISRWFEKTEFKCGKMALCPGGRIFLYTDGILGSFGKESSINKIADFFTASEFNGEAFIKEVRSNLKKQLRDDLTLLVCERNRV